METLGRSITSLLRTPGRAHQTVSESSWDAWIKYYRQDENTPNSQVSYYLKGSLVALNLDLLIRARTRGRKSLDDVMRTLWVRYGQTSAGVPEDGIERITEEVSGLRLRGFFDRALRSTQELQLAQPLREMGLEMQLRAAESWSDRGGKVQPERPARPPIAVGARMGDIAWQATSRIFLMVMTGVVLGAVLGIASVRYVETLLYGVKGSDPVMLTGPALVLLAIAAVSTLPVVVRALRIDPKIMLRAE